MYKSEQHELFSDVTDHFVWNHFKHVEAHCLTQWSAFTNHDDITFFNCERWGAVYRNVSVPLLVPVVLWNVVKIISSYNNCPLHLCWNANTLQDSTSDWNVAGERTFLINVSWFNCLFGRSESEADILEVSDSWSRFFSE